MAAPTDSGLEDKLRTMILSNVSITGSQAGPGTTAQEPHHPHSRGRGRGRGRGGAFQGRGDRNNSQIGRGQPSPRSATHNSFPARRGGTNGPPTVVQPAVQGHPDAQVFSNRGRPRKAANQPLTQNATNQTGTPVSTPQAPRILQRPQVQRPQGPTDSNSPNGPRGQYRQARPQGPHGQPSPNQPPENPIIQVNYLDQLASQEVSKVEISPSELEEKHAFSARLEGILQEAFKANYKGEDITEIKLVGFGSLASGFATPGSDMDLAVVPGWKDPNKALTIGIDREIPRILEKAVLDAKMGGRLLTRTRVPILKVCQSPSETLVKALLEERQKWDDLPEEEKYPEVIPLSEPSPQAAPLLNSNEFPTLAASKEEAKRLQQKKPSNPPPNTKEKVTSPTTPATPSTPASTDSSSKDGINGPPKDQQPRKDRTFLREKTLGPLDFPKEGVGIQCDINFENPLGIHNTRLLRCYSLCDPRVRPIVLFVKAWAKRRKINSSYSGTLSSYGWVLMVLHYLVNIAQPPVCPNLQLIWRPMAHMDVDALEKMFKETTIDGYAVRFFDNEQEIINMAQSRRLTNNTQSIGALLRGFFQYFASVPQPHGWGYGPRPPSFYWTNEVLSLRTPNGIRSKGDKGWTGAKTTVSNGKEVRHRYLFCIEDPFETDHNVARTVTHFGIVAIRDEFRRAWKILSAVGRGLEPEGGIFDEVVEEPPPTPEKVEVEDGAAFQVVGEENEGILDAV
ncbi:PAP/OAS1 substrate-binding domain-containing protein [Byssothecium circinans]|uniref:polynucleotide adenylyltransferase n=1 Tax=Byssothecium circinans TaxID=147558 RepID=A0A6A5UFR3_9PLEO|nr:PAP/OAS1 substrate-binding domain-containing protein [Byssothecium circinans]